MEELTGTDIYGEISRQVFERTRNEREPLERLAAMAEAVNLMTPEARAELEQELAALSLEENRIQKQIRELDRKIQWLERKKGLEAEVVAVEERCAAAARNREKNRGALDRYALCLPAQEIRPFYDRLAQVKENKKTQQRDLEGLALKMETLAARLVRTEKTLADARQEAGEAQKKQRETETLIVEQVVPLDRDIMALERELADLSVRSEKGAERCRTLETQLSALETEASACAADRDQALAYMETHKARAALGELLPLAQTLLEQRTRLREREAGLVRTLEKNARARQAADRTIEASVRETGTMTRTLEDLSAGAADLDNRLGRLTDGLDVEDPDKRYGQLGRMSGPRNTLAALGDRLTQSRQQLKGAQEDLEQTRAELANSPAAHLEAGLTLLKARVRDLEEKRVLEERIQSLSAHREQLQEGTPCPLCGSTDHPLVSQYGEVSPSRTRREQATVAGELADAEEALARENKAQAVRQSRAEALEKELGKTRDLLADLEGQWQKCTQSLGKTFDSAQIREARTWVRAEEALYGRLHTFMEERTATHKEKEALTQKMLRLKDRISEKKQAVEMGRRERETLAERAGELGRERARTADEIRAVETDLAGRLGQLGTLPLPEEQGAWLKRMSALWRQYQDTVRSRELSEQRLMEIREKRGPAEKELALARLAVEEISGQIREKESQRISRVWERRALFGERIPGTERKRMAAEAAAAEQKVQAASEERDRVAGQINSLKGERRSMAQRLDTLAEELETAGREWTAALEGSAFGSVGEFETALLEKSEHDRLRELARGIEQEEAEAKAFLKEAKARLAGHMAQAPPKQESRQEDSDPKDQEILDRKNLERKNLETAQKEVNRRQGEIGEKLKADQVARQHHNDLLSRIETQKAGYDLWVCLSSLIGSRDGDKFRRFAQGLTLDHLLCLANRRLSQLHGRYLLCQKAEETLSLEVVDTWQADAVRDTRTLSGGESFLVSLSLALALSDLVSGKTAIESLFLDEGFGTLDPETLDTALDALDSLNAGGRMIGVISHVDALKERVATRIQVMPRQGLGISGLDMRFAAEGGE